MPLTSYDATKTTEPEDLDEVSEPEDERRSDWGRLWDQVDEARALYREFDDEEKAP